MRARLLLLTGQTVCLGLMMAFLVVPASSLFLVTYGADRLPWAYLVVAAAGVAVSSAMGHVQRRWSLARLSLTVLGGLGALSLAAWVLLAWFDATWVTFVLLVMFPLSIPLGFVLIGNQGGRLLDLQQLKAFFPRVVAGFPVGFAVGGLLAALASRVLGGLHHLLLLELAALGLFMLLVAECARRYPAELRSRPTPLPVAAGRHTPRSPASLPLVRLVFGYQLLSAAVTQLLDFMVWERAAVHYPDEQDLATFMGTFGAVLNVLSIAFVALLGGRLLHRYGVRLGLALNPGAVLVLLAVVVVTGYAAGPMAFVFFLLVCSSQVADIATTDGTTRTSINATYQAVPADLRLRAQTAVEAGGVPLALGLVGALLLVFQALDLGVRALAVTTAVLSVVWLAMAVLTHRAYGHDLQAAYRRRDWDPVSLRVSDAESGRALEQLLSSRDVRDVRLALDVLADAGSPLLVVEVSRLLADADPDRRALGIDGAARAGDRTLAGDVAAAARDRGLPAGLRAAATAVAGRLGAPPDLLLPLLDDAEPNVRTTAATVVDPDSVVPALAAGDADALAAAALCPSAVVGRVLLDLNDAPAAPAALVAALSAHADLIGTEAALRLPAQHRDAALRLLSAVGPAAGPPLIAAGLRHPHREVAAAASRALAARSAGADGVATAVRLRLAQEVVRSERARLMLGVLPDAGLAAPLARALRDDVAETARRIADHLGALHDRLMVDRAFAQLGSGDDRIRALALEALAITVDDVRLLAALSCEPAGRGRGRPGPDPAGLVTELVEDADGAWDEPWLRACALHAAPQLAPTEAGRLATACLADADPVVAETAAATGAVTGPAPPAGPGGAR